jgi:hypothetical protein
MIRYTTAPDAYDGFGTVTLEILPYRNSSGRTPYRKVEIPVEAQRNSWQVDRYHSGLYPALDEETFQDWMQHGLIVEVE